MTDPAAIDRHTNPPDDATVCTHVFDSTTGDICGAPATWYGSAGPRCGGHSLGASQELAAAGDDSDYRGDVRNAIERALAAKPKGGAARTLEAKAEHLHEHLEQAGWVLTHPEPGETPVMLVPGQQVVTVPDGHQVDVTPTLPDSGHGDLELTVLGDIVVQLEGLDPDARERVAGFVTHRYGPSDRPSWLELDRVGGRFPFRTGGVIGRPQATRISE